MHNLSVPHLVEECVKRSESSKGFNMPADTPISYWGMSMMGEGGELCNLLAKLARTKAGAVDGGNSIAAEDITQIKLAEEIGGVFIYLAILSDKLGISLLDAIIKTFNDKSKKIGYPVLLRFAPIIQDHVAPFRELFTDPELLDHSISLPELHTMPSPYRQMLEREQQVIDGLKKKGLLPTKDTEGEKGAGC